MYNIALGQPCITYNTLRELLNLNISIRTLWRRLRKEFIKKWKARGCAKITQRVANERLLWAIEYKDFTAEDWSYIVFTDEVSMEKRDNITDIWVFRRLGEQDECLSKYVKPRIRNIVSLMLWGCFVGYFRSPLIPLHSQQMAEMYIQVLQRYLVPFIIETLPKNGVFDAIFQQDNVPTHKAHIT